jgi:acyl carrier protein
MSRGNVTGAEKIEDWLVDYVARLLEMDPETIDTRTPLHRYGIDSVAAVSMTGDLSAWLGRAVDPTLPYDYPTIEGLARHLA